MEKTLLMISMIETIEDFVKLSTLDYKINEQEAKEILRLLRDVKEIGLK